MSQSSTDPRHMKAPPKKAFRLSWRDERVRSIVWQVLIVGLVVAVVWWLASNTARNLEVRRIATGFGFLWREAGLMNQRLERIGAALACFDRFLDLVPEGDAAARIRALTIELRQRLN